MQRDTFAVETFPGIETVGLEDAPHSVRVCIATEEIIGPVRNGGIASTYYHLAKGLAARGHEVHVLFLKGPVVQDETPQHWVEHFRSFGVTLHYLDIPEGPMWGASPFWQARYLAAYEWLRDRPAFDVVHTSEWRGGMIYALMAKRLGLAFAETLFLVKTSSPHIWNRHYQMQPIQKADLVAACYAEQKCVELADLVIGGSAHLITFMKEIGYRVPESGVFVQPNIVDFSEVPVTDARQAREPGDLMHTDELVFFGRLEGRKGLELFCNALDILAYRGSAPRKVTFMGKYGAPLASQGGVKGADYLAAKCAGWDFETEIITDKNQPEALSHMCSRDMIAVMPSLIENSTMAVYETLEKRIPFIATAVGGTPELIDPADHAACLVAPTSQDLADRLEAALAGGHPVARPSFSNDANLDIWYGFHNFLGAHIANEGRAQAIAALTHARRPEPAAISRLSVVAFLRGQADLDGFAEAAAAAGADDVVLAYSDAGLQPAVEAIAAAAPGGVPVRASNCIGMAAGDALNRAVAEASGEAILLCAGGAARPRPGYAAMAKAALSHRPAALVTTLFTDAEGVLGMPIGGDAASQFFSAAAFGPECVALTRARFDALGGLEPYDRRSGLIHDLVARQAMGQEDLYVWPETLLDWPGAAAETASWIADPVYSYLASKPMIDGVPLPSRKVLLTALNTAMAMAQTGGLRGTGALQAEGMAQRPIPESFAGIFDGHLIALLGDPATLDATGPVAVEAVVEDRVIWAGTLGTGAAYFHPDDAAGGVAVPVEALHGLAARAAPYTVTFRLPDHGRAVSGTIRLAEQPRFADHHTGAVFEARRSVGGWVHALDPDADAAPVQVSVFVDGRFHAALAADGERARLDRACAFSTQIDPRFLRADGSARIDVVLSESGLPLRRAPLMLDGNGVRQIIGPEARARRVILPAAEGAGFVTLHADDPDTLPQMARTEIEICGVFGDHLIVTLAGHRVDAGNPGMVDAVIDGKVVWSGPEGSGAPYVRPARAAASVAVPLAALAPALGPAGVGTVTVRRPGGGPAATASVRLAGSARFGKLYKGACEPRESPQIRGWVRPADGETPLDVAVFLDGRFHIRLTANRARKDLPHPCGFFAALDDAALPAPETPVRIDVLVAESGLPLRRSPMQLVNGQVRESDAASAAGSKTSAA